MDSARLRANRSRRMALAASTLIFTAASLLFHTTDSAAGLVVVSCCDLLSILDFFFEFLSATDLCCAVLCCAVCVLLCVAVRCALLCVVCCCVFLCVGVCCYAVVYVVVFLCIAGESACLTQTHTKHVRTNTPLRCRKWASRSRSDVSSSVRSELSAIEQERRL